MIALFLTLSWTAQSQDSLLHISIEKWKVIRLLEIAQTAASCDSLQVHQEREIQTGIRLQAATDSLLALTTGQLIPARADRGMADQQLANQKVLTKNQIRKKRRWMVITGAMFGVWVVTLVAE